jgi:hypothetical protein
MMRAANPRYFIAVLTATNLALTAVPMPLTAATIAMLMPQAMMAYSIEVAPASSLKKFFNNRRMKKLLPTPNGILPSRVPIGTLDWND